MGKGQLSLRNASRRYWNNLTEEEKNIRRAKARDHYHKNKERISKLKKSRYVGVSQWLSM